jgi:hypothetical protein
MAAFHIAPKRTLPEKLPERMLFDIVSHQLALQFKCNLLLDG